MATRLVPTACDLRTSRQQTKGLDRVHGSVARLSSHRWGCLLSDG
ncbi:hypothetical protein ACVWWN_005545 [Mycobacterium sp. URHB0021]